MELPRPHFSAGGGGGGEKKKKKKDESDRPGATYHICHNISGLPPHSRLLFPPWEQGPGKRSPL